jgi:hypothetical protein
MDCVLLEGPKLLFRIGLALVHLFTKSMSAKNDKFVHLMYLESH